SQLVEQVAAQVGEDLTAGLRGAVRQGQQIGGIEGRPLIRQPGTVRAVLGREGGVGIGEVVDLREGGVDVGLLGARGGRVVGSTAEKEGVDGGVGLAQA